MSRPRVKVCGFTRAEDVRAVAALDLDWIGLNFWPRSKRHVAPAMAGVLARIARSAGIEVVGLFVDQPADELAAVVEEVGLDVVQLHGDEPPVVCAEVAARTGLPVWKAIAVTGPDDVAPAALARWADAGVAAIVLDAASPGRGGSGQTIDWAVAAAAARGPLPVVLAGGLTPANVAAAVAAVAPWAVDVASGVEVAPGHKDPARVAAFVAAARGSQGVSG